MKPVLEYLPRATAESFVVRHFDYSYFPTPWHYHPEIELVLVTSSTGTRFIGDNISYFGPGNLALIGPNLPHLYKNDSKYYISERNTPRAKSIVIHFREEALGNIWTLPEGQAISNLIKASARGLDIGGADATWVSRIMQRMVTKQGLRRWLDLVEILCIIAEGADVKPISWYAIERRNDKDSWRLNKVLELVMNHFHEEIHLKAIAEKVNMNPGSFSRYFRLRTRKTFIQFLNEIRLGHASRLLQEESLSISEICFRCGFNNLSNFNRQFKNYYGINPLSFKKQYSKNVLS